MNTTLGTIGTEIAKRIATANDRTGGVTGDVDVSPDGVTTVTGSAWGKVTDGSSSLRGDANGTVKFGNGATSVAGTIIGQSVEGSQALQGTLTGTVDVDARGTRVGGTAAITTTEGPIVLDGTLTGGVKVDAAGTLVNGHAMASATAGVAQLQADLGGAVKAGATGVSLEGDAAATARLAGLFASVHAEATVGFKRQFPFVDVDGSVSARAGRTPVAPQPAVPAA